MTTRGTAFRDRVRTREPIDGAMIFEFHSSGLPEILRRAGCAFVIYDMEHSAIGFDSLRYQVALCRALGLPALVRVPSSEHTFLSRALDIGATGVMVPMVESAEEARAIASATRYPPVGRRGAAFGFAHDGYVPGPIAEKVADANATTVVIAQIETERAMGDVEAIAAVDGIDALWVGQLDLSNFLGCPGDFAHPAFVAALDRIVAAARANEKGLGYMATTPALAREYRARGFSMIAAGTDQALLIEGLRRVLAGG